MSNPMLVNYTTPNWIADAEAVNATVTNRPIEDNWDAIDQTLEILEAAYSPAPIIRGTTDPLAVPVGTLQYYVDLSAGNDGNTGLSWGAAWKTIDYAVSQVRGHVNRDVYIYLQHTQTHVLSYNLSRLPRWCTIVGEQTTETTTVKRDATLLRFTKDAAGGVGLSMGTGRLYLCNLTLEGPTIPASTKAYAPILEPWCQALVVAVNCKFIPSTLADDDASSDAWVPDYTSHGLISMRNGGVLRLENCLIDGDYNGSADSAHAINACCGAHVFLTGCTLQNLTGAFISTGWQGSSGCFIHCDNTNTIYAANVTYPHDGLNLFDSFTPGSASGMDFIMNKAATV